MRRAASMPSALIKLPLRPQVIITQIQIKHDIQSWATNSSRLWRPIQRRDGRMVRANARTRNSPLVAAFPAATTLVPSGDQPGCKIGQQPRVAGEPEVGIGKPGVEQPIVELRRPFQAEQIADVKGVMER